MSAVTEFCVMAEQLQEKVLRNSIENLGKECIQSSPLISRLQVAPPGEPQAEAWPIHWGQVCRKGCQSGEMFPTSLLVFHT